MYFNIIKAIYDKPIVNITLREEKLNQCPLKSGLKQGCSVLFNILLEFLARTTRQKEK
jgi:hypothetical protein